METIVSIGNQGFDRLREEGSFYIDKTYFIKEWWESRDVITLITRPRRFGKTLNMNMLYCFFSNQYVGRDDLFENLSIWKEEKYKKLQGTYPTVFLSFAGIKADNLEDAKSQIKLQIAGLYEQNRYLLETNLLSDNEKNMYQSMTMTMSDVERGIMTGITRVSKESVFLDLNNLNVVTTTSDEYSTCFGFTQEEVTSALELFGCMDQLEEVQKWYDGFTFGSTKDIYNPWSITNYLDKKRFSPYWAATSSNGLINRLIQSASADVKMYMEDLLKDKEIIVNFDEQIVFDQLDSNKDAIWSLLVASGYLKVEQVEYRGVLRKPWYHLRITNLETYGIFSDMFIGWFDNSMTNYNAFVEALLQGDLKAMNAYINDVALTTFSHFDTGKHPSGKTQPERFYHGFVLGLLVELRDSYDIRSNRESGYGRYDVMIIPRDHKQVAYVLEFKALDTDEENCLEDTVQAALHQIEEKQYDNELISLGIEQDHIRHYGFAFQGKKVLIG